MDARQMALLRSSWAALAPQAEQAAALFYDRVFERAPQALALFHGDMALQAQHLIAMIGGALALLDKLPQLTTTLERLGQRHTGYGVQPEHYGVVGGALLDTLECALGAAFTPLHRQAWAQFYELARQAMCCAAPAAITTPAEPVRGVGLGLGLGLGERRSVQSSGCVCGVR